MAGACKRFSILMAMVLATLGMAAAADSVMYVEQDYSIVRQEKDGVEAKDIRQKLYLTADAVRIDEYAGPSKQPTESYLIDFKARQIVNLDHEKLNKLTESFDGRKERIEKRKQKIREDLEALPEGKQREQTQRLYRALLDDQRAYKVERPKDLAELEVLGVKAEAVRIVDERDPAYVPLATWLHPDLEVPYDNAEVLYLLQIIGPKMAQFLRENKSVFRRLPMKLELDLAAGGTLKTQVVKVESVERRKLAGDLFQVPEGYKEKKPGAAETAKTGEVAPD